MDKTTHALSVPVELNNQGSSFGNSMNEEKCQLRSLCLLVAISQISEPTFVSGKKELLMNSHEPFPLVRFGRGKGLQSGFKLVGGEDI